MRENNFLISFKLEYKFRNLKSIKHHYQISFGYKCIVNNYINTKPIINMSVFSNNETQISKITSIFILPLNN